MIQRQAASIRAGGPADLRVMIQLMEAAGLPTADLAGAAAVDLWVADAGGSLVSRESVPAAVRNSAEFRTLCPASALYMTRPLAASKKEDR